MNSDASVIPGGSTAFREYAPPLDDARSPPDIAHSAARRRSITAYAVLPLPHMTLGDIEARASQLVEKGRAVQKTEYQITGYGRSVDSQRFNDFRSSALSFLKRVFGEDSPYYGEFDKRVTSSSPYDTKVGVGILEACQEEIAGGWLFTTRGLVSAEVFADFLEMASHLLSEGYKDPAAVLIGSVLEEHLRQLCIRHGLDTEVERDGKLTPMKADRLNAELAKAEVYNKLVQKNVTAWLDLRNQAAHGHYDQYDQSQVDYLLTGVTDFMARLPA